jgi:hypothetical protein
MSKLRGAAARLFSVPYSPRPEGRPFLDRARTREEDGLAVTVAALSDAESHRFFGVRLAHKGLQPVWLRVVNRTARPCRLDFHRLDPAYYTALEAAYVNHFAPGKRLLSFGLLAWLFLPLLPLVPLKFFGARAANRRMNAFFQAQGFRPGPIPPGGERSGFVFTALDEGLKSIDVRLVAGAHSQELTFALEVPGLALGPTDGDAAATAEPRELDEAALRAWAEGQPPCTTNRRGTAEGDPLNLVVVGERATVRQCFGARWDEAEVVDLATCWKTARAFLFDAGYRYSPVSPLYVGGERQHLALQRARASINERLHLRLWRTSLTFGGRPVWIGQISRDIGVRFTTRAWNLTTHRIDPDVDEARDYLIDDLMAARRLARVGHVGGVRPAPATAPRRNLTGDPYFTDGQRAVLVLSASRTDAAFFPWS